MGEPTLDEPGHVSAPSCRCTVLDRSTVCAQYDREMRRDPPASSGARFERAGTLVREQHDSDTVIFSQLTSDTAPAAVAEEVRRARSLGRELEWKVYAHDTPPELPTLLGAAGFQPDEPETLVALDLTAGAEPPIALEGLAIREVRELPTFRDALLVSEAAFGPSGPETLEKFRYRLDDPTARLFVAY
ncbi:MAG: hypothetical protein L3K02_05600, partial [Thermoplasmata archaeon]|nr:hypothetical protein [Thermoplasmata archaeon]